MTVAMAAVATLATAALAATAATAMMIGGKAPPYDIGSPMRMMLLLTLALAGCAQVDASMMVQQGRVRVEPHPTDPTARRIVATASPDALAPSPREPSTGAGQRALAAALLGENCTDVVEESRSAMAPVLGFRQELVTLRVRCP
jgi:hypothetical protein